MPKFTLRVAMSCDDMSLSTYLNFLTRKNVSLFQPLPTMLVEANKPTSAHRPVKQCLR